MTHTQIIERCRSAIDHADRLKPRLDEPFERLVLRNTVIEAYAVIRGGDINAIKAMTAKIMKVCDLYSKEPA